jgi:hypothetical protein
MVNGEPNLPEGSHEVEISLRPERTVKLFRKMLDRGHRGHVLVKFTRTRGGTDLGVPLDKSRSDLTQADSTLLAIVCFSRCCSDDTRAYIAAILMNASPCWLRANEALSSGHQNIVRLCELTLAQAIKHIV